jgi:hypothetical protein
MPGIATPQDITHRGGALRDHLASTGHNLTPDMLTLDYHGDAIP